MTKQENLIYKINKKEYLLFEYPISSNSKWKRQEKEVLRLGGIIQGCKEIKQAGFFSSGYAIIKILVPTNKIDDFQKIS